MTEIILTFPVCKAVPLSCVWINTGNPAQPLACKWTACRESGTDVVAVEAKERERRRLCA